MYNTVLKPMWTYGIELWGSAKPSDISKIQSYNPNLCTIECAPFYISNRTLHTDLQTSFVKQVVIDRYDTFHNRTILHPNPLFQSLTNPQLPDNPILRLRTFQESSQPTTYHPLKATNECYLHYYLFFTKFAFFLTFCIYIISHFIRSLSNIVLCI